MASASPITRCTSWCATNCAPNPRCRARPTQKNAEAVTAFQATFADRLHQHIPADAGLPVKVWASDESRFGLHTIQRRRITARGTKPIGTHQHDFKNFWIYGAVAPTTGESHFMEFPRCNRALFQQFLDDFAASHPATLNIVLLDNARSHKASDLRLPTNVVLLFQEPYAPELNPCERVWQAFKDALAWACFPELDALRQHMVTVVRAFDEAMLRSLTAYPYIMHAINAVYP